jgi:hypothetical protein
MASTKRGPQEVIGLTANFTTSGTVNKGDLVKVSGDDIVQCGAITDPAIGVALQTTPGTGGSVSVQLSGIALVKNKSGVTAGQEVMPSTTAGQVATAAGATAYSVGVALMTGADGEYVPVLLATPGVKRPPNA